MNYNNIFVISDLDGTLLGSDKTIPKRNLEAIARFQSKGGRFAIATGRSVITGAPYIDAVSPNGPSVVLNGTIIYDSAEQKILWNLPLNTDNTIKYVKIIRERFSGTGIEIYSTDSVGVLKVNPYVTRHLSKENLLKSDPNIFNSRTLCKVLFMDDADVIQKMVAFTETFEHEDVRFVLSCENYLEMLPTQADKGSALKRIISSCGFPMENVYAIGDYYNDIELLQAAGFAAMPQNSPDELKKYADMVVCDCSEGAVADLIEYIERKAE